MHDIISTDAATLYVIPKALSSDSTEGSGKAAFIEKFAGLLEGTPAPAAKTSLVWYRSTALAPKGARCVAVRVFDSVDFNNTHSVYRFSDIVTAAEVGRAADQLLRSEWVVAYPKDGKVAVGLDSQFTRFDVD